MRRRPVEVLTKGWPVVTEVGEMMPGPPGVVWDLITDWERQGDWMLEASDFVVTSEHREGVGVTAEATVTIGGITTRDKVRVVVWEPSRRLVIEHGGRVTGRGDLHLTQLGPDRTHLFWTEQLAPPLGVLGALGISAFKPLMRRVFKRDIKVLAALVRAATRAGA